MNTLKQLKPSEILQAALEKIKKPENWIKKAWARDKRGRDVTANNPEAVSFCAIGSVYAVPNPQRFGQAFATHYLSKVVPNGITSLWNDREDTEHLDVLSAFGNAIALAQREGN